MENGRVKAMKLAQELGCNTQTSRELVDCLRHRPARMIVQQVATFQVKLSQDKVKSQPYKHVVSDDTFIAVSSWC
jgi:hypothetical protein